MITTLAAEMHGASVTDHGALGGVVGLLAVAAFFYVLCGGRTGRK